MTGATLLVIAKAPVAGRVKTRLCPPCTPEQAASIARAAIEDTLAAVGQVAAERRVVVLDGEPGPWLPDGFDVIPQCAGSLDRRLAAAFEGVDGPAFLVGMDTPQLTPGHIATALDVLFRTDVDAVLGPAEDGGWWGIGLRVPQPEVFRDVPMSTNQTVSFQLRRMRFLALRTCVLDLLVDVDTFADARAVAAMIPDSRFADAVRSVGAVESPERVR
ncbi:MAG: glycosyltransferase [Actinomycetota bacterium]|nr:glycosyltransferase [Actinomycetota bacterium]